MKPFLLFSLFAVVGLAKVFAGPLADEYLQQHTSSEIAEIKGCTSSPPPGLQYPMSWFCKAGIDALKLNPRDVLEAGFQRDNCDAQIYFKLTTGKVVRYSGQVCGG